MVQRILDENTHTSYIDAVFAIKTVNYAHRPTINIVKHLNPEVYTGLATLGLIDDKTDTSNESVPNAPKMSPIRYSAMFRKGGLIMASGLTSEMVLQLINEGFSQAEIGRRFGVSRQAVNKLAKRGGFSSVRKSVDPHIPWEIDAEFNKHRIFQMVKAHGTYMIHGEEGLTVSTIEGLLSFYNVLKQRSAVVDYDPDFPGEYRVSAPGFKYAPRRKKDEDYIIKIRPGVKLTAEGKKIWRLPKELPDPAKARNAKK